MWLVRLVRLVLPNFRGGSIAIHIVVGYINCSLELCNA